MKLSIFPSAFLLSLLSFSHSHPLHDPRSEVNLVRRNNTEPNATTILTDASTTTSVPPTLQILANGNQAFRDRMNQEEPGLFQNLTEQGQSPPFMFLGCSDSRVSEFTIFDALPGTLFAERNIANQFHSSDPNAHSVLAYAVAVLGVQHVIVMGHYGCGGVAAAIASPPSTSMDVATSAVQTWIEPIRELYQSSNRTEIVQLREQNNNQTVVGAPGINDPGFRALVEENVKAAVQRIASDNVILNHYTTLNSPNTTQPGGTPQDVFIHGWVYDISNGEIHDLGVSVGPPGVPIPAIPFSVVTPGTVSA
ncbi:hypothetical protein NP233_g3181 [Leucocoprinus birnbaumii]|uniref:Carbonic anhydrase n=1 Tax=Leucocoprinus birnbaumii TaxID=56174 RepID=A0AAD5YY57_9AGAR|nr:hypothetical protein NP233_g3181 [Leucocoprinus birnbaumii]